MNLCLWENMPLRTAAALGSFASADVLPIRFGDLRNTRFPLKKLSDTEWFAADHPMTITAVYVDDEKTLTFATELRGDGLGTTYTVVILGGPAPPDSKVSASGVGLLNPTTGARIENPAEIMEFALRQAGRTETFPLLRAECAAEGIVLAGSFDRVQSIRAWLDEIAYSAGAIWTPEAARLYPVDYIRGSIAPLDRFAATLSSVDSALDDTADILRIYYDVNDATGQPQQFVELTASPQRFGGISAEITLRWMRQAANAETIGKRTLGRMAGVRYSITMDSDQVKLRPCQWTRLVNHPQWQIPGAYPTPMILRTEVDYEKRTSRLTAEVIASTPTITVSAHSIALPTTTTASASISIVGNVANFTILDKDGKPIKNAQCALDGGAAKKTNEAGVVSFTIQRSNPPIKHHLAIEAIGKVPMDLEVFY